jgi:chromosome segregation ATPase
MLKSKLFLLCALPLTLYSAAAEAKLYKWVDENGQTHYGQTIPPEYAGEKKVRIEDGMEVKEKAKPVAKPKAKEAPRVKTSQEIEQERHDQALLATYANEGEIDDQRDRSLQLVNARISGLEQQLQSAQQDLEGVQKDSDGGKTTDRALQNQLAQAKHRVSNLQDALAAARDEAEKVKAKYAADKQRYRELTAPKPQE